MRIRELVERLRAIQGQHGNVHVYVRTADAEHPFATTTNAIGPTSVYADVEYDGTHSTEEDVVADNSVAVAVIDATVPASE